MFNTCVDTCSEATWNARVGNYLFCQVAFHILFWADFYLGQDEHSFRRQRFHRENEHFFAGYEEFEDRAPTSLYDQAMVKAYLEHCRNKASEAIATETDDSLSGPSGFERRAFSRAELHIYNIRHIQHHTAMLSG